MPGAMPAWIAPVLALWLLAGCVAPQGAASRHDDASPSDCRVTYVVDGDTVHLACRGRGLVKARLLGFDTPEVFSPACPAERRAGQEATQILQQMVRTAPVTRAEFRGHDRYGRDLVRLEIGGRDVARSMIGTGLALPYAGGRHPDWCARLSR